MGRGDTGVRREPETSVEMLSWASVPACLPACDLGHNPQATCLGKEQSSGGEAGCHKPPASISVRNHRYSIYLITLNYCWDSS